MKKKLWTFFSSLLSRVRDVAKKAKFPKSGKKRLFPYVLAGALFCILAGGAFLSYSYSAVERAGGRVYGKETLSRMPCFEYALVLGTNPRLKNGDENLYFRYRMEAAVLLYKAGKCRKIVLSGDNGRKSYDETSAMQQDLRKRGIPGKDLLCDYAGFRTLDSVLRMRNVFGAEKFLIVSQKWHCQRAIFIGKAHRLDVAGFAAEDVPFAHSPLVMVREVLARALAVLDVKIWKKKPHFEY